MVTIPSALILNANGIKTYLFENLRPVPELSYAVRELGCTAGVMITASHNPPQYNGYKVYWDDGAQIVEPIDAEIIQEVNNITDLSSIKTMNKEKGLIFILKCEPTTRKSTVFIFAFTIYPAIDRASVSGFNLPFYLFACMRNLLYFCFRDYQQINLKCFAP